MYSPTFLTEAETDWTAPYGGDALLEVIFCQLAFITAQRRL